MLKIDLDMQIPVPDAEAFTEAVVQKLMYSMIEGARQFFINAVPLVHIDTGMSLGSFIGLATFLDEQIDRLNERITYSPPKKYIDPPPELKLPETGALLGSKPDELFEIDYARARVRFKFHTSVWQFEHYEGWGSIEAGIAAMNAYLANNVPRLPNINKFVTRYNYRTTQDGRVRRSIERVRRQRTLRSKSELE